MNTKRFVLLPLLSNGLLIASAASAAPLVSIGDNADLFFDGSANVRWSSNVFRQESNEDEDVVYTLSPGFELNVGRGLSNMDFVVSTRYDVERYTDNDQLDNETFHASALGSYSGSHLDLSGSVSFDESKATTGEKGFDTVGTNELIESESVGARLNGEYRFSPKFSFGAGVSYQDAEYQTQRTLFADREVLSFPFDLFYELTPKVDLSVGYQYTQRSIEDKEGANDGYDSESHYVNVGARGDLLPKLKGFFKVGYRQNEIDLPGRDSTGMLGANADLTWTVTPKLTTQLELSRDFGVGGDGGSTEASSVNLVGSYSIDSQWSASTNAGYTLREYDVGGREDDLYRLGARLTYVLNQSWRFSGGYTYTDNDSSFASADYVNHMLDFTASLRY